MRDAMPTCAVSPDNLYAKTIEDYGDALDRLCRAYEADTDKRRDSFDGTDSRNDIDRKVSAAMQACQPQPQLILGRHPIRA
jgi:hypothetical protein